MRSVHTLRFAVLAALAGAVLISCGGGSGANGGGSTTLSGGDSTTLSVTEFREQADAICLAFFDKIEALGAQPTTPEEFLDYSKKALPIIEEGHRQLRQLVPPDNLSETWNRGLAANDEIDRAFRDLVDALEEGDVPSAQELVTQIDAKNDEAGRAAREVGLNECG